MLPINFLIVFLFRRANPGSTTSESSKQKDKLKLAAAYARPRAEHKKSLFSKIESIESGGIDIQYDRNKYANAGTVLGVPHSNLVESTSLAKGSTSNSLPDLSRSELGKNVFLGSTNTFQDSSVFHIKEKITMDDLQLCKNNFPYDIGWFGAYLIRGFSREGHAKYCCTQVLSRVYF